MSDRRITQFQMAQQLAYLAGRLASWSGDLLTLPENPDKPVRVDDMAYFTDQIRKRLDHLDEWAGRAALATKEPANAR